MLLRPYRIAEVINDVAYRLKLPARTRLHDVFHVGVLKKFVGTPPTALLVLPPTHFDTAVPEPERATCSSCPRRAPAPRPVEWQTCIIGHLGGRRQLRRPLPPNFQLKDELLVERGRDVMWGRHYQRRPRVQANPGAANGTQQQEVMRSNG